MDEKGVKQIKKLITDFRLLATKVQKDDKEKSKNLKDTNQVLDACKKEYQKCYENEALKKRITELQEELTKYQSENNEKNNKKIRLLDTEFDEEKIKKLFKKPKIKKKRKYYYDDYHNSDEADVESDSSDEDDDRNESEYEEINARKKKKTLKWRKT